MDLNKWTVKSQEALQSAMEFAQEAGNPELTPLHLALALFDDEDGVAKQAALKIGNVETYRSILRVLRRRMERLPTQQPAPDQIPPSAELRKTLSNAAKIQKKKGDAYLSALPPCLAPGSCYRTPCCRSPAEVDPHADSSLTSPENPRPFQSTHEQCSKPFTSVLRRRGHAAGGGAPGDGREVGAGRDGHQRGAAGGGGARDAPRSRHRRQPVRRPGLRRAH